MKFLLNSDLNLVFLPYVFALNTYCEISTVLRGTDVLAAVVILKIFYTILSQTLLIIIFKQKFSYIFYKRHQMIFFFLHLD
jgi:hypothetical protein